MTTETASLKLTMQPSENAGDDPIMLQLERDMLRAGPSGELAHRGRAPTLEATEEQTPPFLVEIGRPRAISLRALYALTNRPLPPTVLAALGPNEPILIHHGITPFHPPLARPRPLWGLGYAARLVSGDADTVDLAPREEFLRVGGIRQELRVGLGIGGQLGLLPPEVAAAAALTGISIPDAHIEASTDQSLQISIRFALTLLKVEAGRVGAGGARWHMYRQDQRLDRSHLLLQTLLVRPGTKELVFEIETWAKSSGVLFGLGAVGWQSEPQTFRVATE